MKPKIFISSTFYDQQHIRDELARFIEEKNYEAVLSERGDIGYVSGTPLDLSCYASVQSCNMTVLLVGGKYGSPATGENDSDPFNEYLSITRNEFKSAIDSHKTIFVFIDKSVLAEYQIYKRNKSAIESKTLPINFNATDNINVFRFIEEIYNLKAIPVFGFENGTDIKTILSKQWADLMFKLLVSIQEKAQGTADENVDELSIAGEWVSMFVEGNNILHENIQITQKGRKVIAHFTLGTRKYEFQGQFKNRILMGEYHSEQNARKDERGNMMLKLIGDSMLSGQITFVYNNEQVSTSPYVWVLKSKHDLSQGAYGFCSSCVAVNRKCCCANDDVDMPILLPFEVEQISKKYHIDKNDFAQLRSQNLSQMKRVKIDDTLDGCYFYDGQKCKIYENRPIDCRLFPFDVIFENGKYRLVYYTSVCPSIDLSVDVDTYAHNIKPLLSLMYPYLSESTFTEFNQKLKHHTKKDVGPLTKYL